MPIVTESGRQYLKLSDVFAEELAKLPEIAMGYQLVDIYLHDGRIVRQVYVASGRYIALPIPFKEDEIAKFHTSTPHA